MVLFSAWAGSKGCDAVTGRLLNDSGIGWNVLTSRGDLRPGRCSNIHFSLSPGGRLSQSTVKLECRGPSAVVKLYSYGSWQPCDESRQYHGLVFPNGYNCSARAPGFLPLYELSLTSDVCSNRPIPRVGAPIGKRSLEFVGVQNVYVDWVRGIGSTGGNATNKVFAAEKVASWGHGIQVLILSSGILEKKASAPVTLSVEVLESSTSRRWDRVPKLLGVLTAKPVMGVASFGNDLGMKQAGTYRFKACLQDGTCVTSNVVQVLPQGVTKTVVLGQPGAQTFKLVNPTTGNADFGKVPINVTWADAFNNYGAQVDLYNATTGLASMNVTCASVGNPRDERMVWTERTQWGKRGYAEFYSMGNLKAALELAFGSGSVAGNLEGWKCWGQVNMNREWRDRTKARSVKTQSWTFSPIS